jgi:hypothetical protein
MTTPAAKLSKEQLDEIRARDAADERSHKQLSAHDRRALLRHIDALTHVDELREGPSVIGGHPAPMPKFPTPNEYRQMYKRAYVACFVAVGLDEETPAQWFEDLNFDDLKDTTPEEAANDEMEYWDND